MVNVKSSALRIPKSNPPIGDVSQTYTMSVRRLQPPSVRRRTKLASAPVRKPRLTTNHNRVEFDVTIFRMVLVVE